jgi:ankyrin repeat protein
LTCLPQDGWTALHHACWRDDMDVVSVLLSAGAPIEFQTQVRSGRRINKSCVLFICVQDGKTPLHFACAQGAAGLVSELLAAGAHIEARDLVSEFESVFISQPLTVSSVSRMDSPPLRLLSR